MTDRIAKLIIDSLEIHIKVVQALISGMRAADFSSDAFLALNDAAERERFAQNIVLLLAGRGHVFTPAKIEAIKQRAKREAIDNYIAETHLR